MLKFKVLTLGKLMFGWVLRICFTTPCILCIYILLYHPSILYILAYFWGKSLLAHKSASTLQSTINEHFVPAKTRDNFCLLQYPGSGLAFRLDQYD